MNYARWAQRMGFDLPGDWQRHPGYQHGNIEWFKRDDPEGYERDIRGEPPPEELDDPRRIEAEFRVVEKEMSEERTVWAVYRSTGDYYEQHPELVYLVSTKEEALRIEASDPELWAAEERVYDEVFIPEEADEPVRTGPQPPVVGSIVDWEDALEANRMPFIRKITMGEADDSETISEWGR